MWTWSYPAVTESQKTVVTRKCNMKLEHSAPHVFVCARHGHDWFYIHCSEVFDSDKLPKVGIYIKVSIFFIKRSILSYSQEFLYLVFKIISGKTVCIDSFCKGF